MPISLTPTPLTAQAFEPFGQILELPLEPGRVDYSAFAENLRNQGAALCFRTSLTPPSELPLRTRVMERHLLSSQAFLPVDVSRYLVLVAPHHPGGGPDIGRLMLFLADGRQGINYRPDVWHHPMTVLDRPAIFATVMFNDGGSDDEQFVELSDEVVIGLPGAP